MTNRNFTGRYYHNIDAKNRIMMPSKFRELLGEDFYITEGFEGCINVLPADEWDELSSQMKALPKYSADARLIRRTIGSGAVTCEADKQGRILIPGHLKEHAALSREVVIIGVIDNVEIWDSEKWQQYRRGEGALTMEDAAANLEKQRNV